MDIQGFIDGLMGMAGHLSTIGLSTYGMPNWLVLTIIFAILYVIWDQTIGNWTKPITIVAITYLIGSFLGLI